MKNNTQKEWVLSQLKERGFITRNECLSKFISRLGAIICSLCKEGYDIKGENLKTDRGLDYIYKLTPRQVNFL